MLYFFDFEMECDKVLRLLASHAVVFRGLVFNTSSPTLFEFAVLFISFCLRPLTPTRKLQNRNKFPPGKPKRNRLFPLGSFESNILWNTAYFRARHLGTFIPGSWWIAARITLLQYFLFSTLNKNLLLLSFHLDTCTLTKRHLQPRLVKTSHEAPSHHFLALLPFRGIRGGEFDPYPRCLVTGHGACTRHDKSWRRSTEGVSGILNSSMCET